MTDYKALIAEARKHGLSASDGPDHNDQHRRLIHRLADALEVATARVDREPQPGDGPDYHADHASWLNRNRAVVEAQALEQAADQIEAGLDEWGASGNDEYLVNEILDPLVKRVRERAVEIREGRQ